MKIKFNFTNLEMNRELNGGNNMKKRIVLFATLLTLVFTGCSSSTPAPTENSAELESLKAQVDELKKENADLKTQLESIAEETTAAETTSSTSENMIQLGEASTLGNWSITATAAQSVDSIPDGYGTFSPDDGNKYFVVSLSVTNNGKTAGTFLPSFSMGTDVQAKIVYGDGYQFSATHLLGYSKTLHDQTLNPLSTKDGDIAFEIPDNVASASDELILQLKSGNSVVNIKVR